MVAQLLYAELGEAQVAEQTANLALAEARAERLPAAEQAALRAYQQAAARVTALVEQINLCQE